MEIKIIKTEKDFHSLKPGDVVKLKVQNSPTRARIISINPETRVVSFKYTKKRQKFTQTKITALTFDEILNRQYQDNVKKWVTVATTLAIGTGGVIAYRELQAGLELVKLINKLLNL